MKLLRIQGYEIDRCMNCKGLWFDHLEYEELKLVDKSEIIDVGDAKIGRQLNKIQDINCPVCKTPMGKMVPDDQPDIWYEGCGTCHGVFFDAGEFKTFLKNNSVLSFKNLRPE